MDTLPADALPAQLATPQYARLTDWDTAVVDGVQFRVEIDYQPADPSVGIFGESFGVCPRGEPKLIDREEWDAYHAPIAPTLTAMRYLRDHSITSDLLDRAAEARAHDERVVAAERDYDDSYGGAL